MGIEIALREHTFTSDLEKAVTNLILAHNWVMEKFKTDLERFNLTSQQFNILRILKAESKPLSTMQIRDRMLDKMSDTSRIVDRLVAKDLVSKKWPCWKGWTMKESGWKTPCLHYPPKNC
jgi:hypothetical protein